MAQVPRSGPRRWREGPPHRESFSGQLWGVDTAAGGVRSYPSLQKARLRGGVCRMSLALERSHRTVRRVPTGEADRLGCEVAGALVSSRQPLKAAAAVNAMVTASNFCISLPSPPHYYLSASRTNEPGHRPPAVSPPCGIAGRPDASVRSHTCIQTIALVFLCIKMGHLYAHYLQFAFLI